MNENFIAYPDAYKRTVAEDAVAYPDLYKQSTSETAIAYPDPYKRAPSENAITYPDAYKRSAKEEAHVASTSGEGSPVKRLRDKLWNVFWTASSFKSWKSY
ncbi:MAG: hypothetical protein Q9183_001727 [Haloplaca sp. 2 TL-2023]